jgi:hypothetical protein
MSTKEVVVALRLKARACREAIKRSNPGLRNQDTYRACWDELIRLGEDPWMLRASMTAQPHDDEWTTLARCFDLAADALVLLQKVKRMPGRYAGVRARCFKLAAEASASLRAAHEDLQTVVPRTRVSRKSDEAGQRQMHKLLREFGRRWRINAGDRMTRNYQADLTRLPELQEQVNHLMRMEPQGGAA